MNSIYERLVNLPLFKGASQDFINTFAEKTPLDFISYSSGEVIIDENRACDQVICLISGSVRIKRIFCGGNLIVNEVLHSGSILGFENLYGLHTKFRMTITAAEEAGVMQFSKRNFFYWLSNSPLLLLNSLNYLSRCAQNGTDALMKHELRDIESEFSYLIQTATYPHSTDISISSPKYPFEELLAPKGCFQLETLRMLEERGLIRMRDGHTIDIPSRSAFLDAFREE